MATLNSTPAFHRAAIGLYFTRLYRAHIGAESCGKERTAFVEAASHAAAIRKIANTVAVLESRNPDTVEERIYNCHSAQELIDEGMSEDVMLRLFEIGWSGGGATSFVDEPLFLVSSAILVRKWAAISSPEVAHG